MIAYPRPLANRGLRPRGVNRGPRGRPSAARLGRSGPVGVVAEIELLPFLRGERAARHADLGEGLEVRLTRGARGEEDQHRGGLAGLVAERVDAALRHVKEVSGLRVDPPLPV